MTGPAAVAWIRRSQRQWAQLPARIRARIAPVAADRAAELLQGWAMVDRQRAGLLARLVAGQGSPASLQAQAVQVAGAMALGIRAVDQFDFIRRQGSRPRILARRPTSSLLGAALPELGAGETESAFLARLRAVKDPQAIADLQTRYAGQLHAAALAINQAKSRDDVATVRTLLPIYIVYRNRYLAAGAKSLELSTVDKFILDTGNYLAAAVAALPNAIAAVPAGIFAGIWKAVQLPVLLAAGGFVLYKILEHQAPASPA